MRWGVFVVRAVGCGRREGQPTALPRPFEPHVAIADASLAPAKPDCTTDIVPIRDVEALRTGAADCNGNAFEATAAAIEKRKAP